jgi:hypothetical protein
MFFQPYRNYVITRQIYNERDLGQVWVKAWARDSVSDETLLDGVEMTESVDNKGRFKYTFKLPADPSGNGRQLRITSVVYSDSGYTTRKTDYQVEETDIVVRDMHVMEHGGGGSDVDYKKIRKIVKEELAKLPPYPITDLSDIRLQIKDAKNAISGLIRGLPDVDLSNIEDNISQLVKVIASIPPYPEQEKFDYSGINEIIDKIKELKNGLVILEKQPKFERMKDYNEIKKVVSETTKTIETSLNEILDKLEI